MASIGKKVIFFLVIVLAGVAGVAFATRQFAKPSVSISIPKKLKASPIRFGGTLDYSAGQTKEAVEAQLKLLGQLGIRTVRTKYLDCGFTNWFMNDQLLEAAKRNNIEVVFILEPQIDFKKPVKKSNLPTAAIDCGSVTIGKQKGTSPVDLEQYGYDYTKAIVEKYQDQVSYWQLINEVGGTAMTGNADGRLPEQFDKTIYKRLAAFLKGSSRAVAEADPSAKRIVNNQWLHVGMLDLLAQDKIAFDIIGWNWFVDDIDMGSVEYAPGQYFNLFEELEKRKSTTGAKEIWLSEFNKDHGSFEEKDKEQADYLGRKLPELIGKKVFSAIFVHELFDKPAEKLEQDRHWGIIEVETSPTIKLTPKTAAQVVSEIVQE